MSRTLYCLKDQMLKKHDTSNCELFALAPIHMEYLLQNFSGIYKVGKSLDFPGVGLFSLCLIFFFIL